MCVIGKNEWKTEVYAKKQSRRSIRNIKAWMSPFDHDGNSPLDLLSSVLSTNLTKSKRNMENTCVLSYGKADVFLGFPLTNAFSEITKPGRVNELCYEQVTHIAAAKYHSIALTKQG